MCFPLSIAKRWNAPLGNLPSTSFCVGSSNTTAEEPSWERAGCVLIPFAVPSAAVREHCAHTLQAVVRGGRLKSRSESSVHTNPLSSLGRGLAMPDLHL